LRRIIGGSITNNALKKFQGTFQKYSMELMDAIGKVAQENDGVVDMTDWFHRLSLDVQPLKTTMVTDRLRARLHSDRVSKP